MPNPYKGKTGLRRLINACGYSVSGLRAAYRLEDAFRQEIALAAVLIPLALYLPVAADGRALLLASVFLVLIVELLMLRAALSGEGLVYTFQVLFAVAVFMTIVHVQGAVQRIQPITETLEIGMYSGLGILAVLFYPA